MKINKAQFIYLIKILFFISFLLVLIDNIVKILFHLYSFTPVLFHVLLPDVRKQKEKENKRILLGVTLYCTLIFFFHFMLCQGLFNLVILGPSKVDLHVKKQIYKYF